MGCVSLSKVALSNDHQDSQFNAKAGLTNAKVLQYVGTGKIHSLSHGKKETNLACKMCKPSAEIEQESIYCCSCEAKQNSGYMAM